MFIFKKINEIQKHLSGLRFDRKTIGFVPTMGALHQGHISLIERAKKENDAVVCSIFVNPTQFNNQDDLAKYPRTIEKDMEMLISAKNDVLFLPEVEEMYPQHPASPQPSPKERGKKGEGSKVLSFGEDLGEVFDFGYLENILEGKSRPGHFKGVAQIVSKLLNVVRPDTMYLGQKDYQQFLVVKKLLEQMKSEAKLVMCPVVREQDGLAMSSRNVRLLEKGRKDALILSQTLFAVKEKMMLKPIEEIKIWAKKNIQTVSSAELDYFEICNAETLKPIHDWKEAENIIALVAVKLEGVRLIDNIFLLP